MTKHRFDAVLIDFYGTIAAGDRDAVAGACGSIVQAYELPTSADAFAIHWGEHFFAMLDQSNHESFRTLYECEVLSLRTVLATYGKDGDPSRFVDPIESYWSDPPLHKDARELLDRIDLPVCCVSNADREPLRTAIQRHALSFDAVITSEEASCYKPDPAIFRRALEMLDVDAQRALHVGDSLHSDIAGAARAGLTSVWIQRENRIHDIGRCRPDHTIMTLVELIPLLG